MRWFMDTEFAENGETIKLISIALINEPGDTYYYACAEDGWTVDDCNDWVRANVLPRLPRLGDFPWRTRGEIAFDLEVMLLGREHKPDTPEIWGYFAAYDWVVFCQLFGRMVDLPKGMPMWIRDLKQLMSERGITRDQLPKQDESNAHDALADARWIREAWLAINGKG